MPRHDWFYHIPLNGGNRRQQDRLRKLNERGGDESELRAAPEPATYHRIRQHRHCKVRIGQHETYAYRLSDIAAIYGLHPNTVLGWYRKGMLPPPHHISPTMYRSWGWQNRPVYYLKEQVLVICKVLDDIFGQGVTQYRQSHIHHAEMMREGCEIALARLPYKAVKPKPVKLITTPEPKPSLRHRPAPHLRPMLRQFRAALYHHQQHPYSKSWAAQV